MPSFVVVGGIGMDYARGMATVGDIPRPRPRPRPSQDETSPFPLEFVVVSNQRRYSQNETAPFPLQITALPRRKRVSQDETSPFLLTLDAFEVDASAVDASEVDASEVDAKLDRDPAPAPRAGRARDEALPSLTWRGLDASSELRQYAARIASGEDLPPFRGPIIAGQETPAAAPAAAPLAAPETGPQPVETNPLKVALGLIVLMAAIVASATAGDDASLRAAGQSISRWFAGESQPLETLVPPAPAAPAQTPCLTAAPSGR
jgi:hypothetical protein